MKIKLLIMFLSFCVMSGCVAQPIVVSAMPTASHPDVLISCKDKYTGESLNYFKSYSSTTVLQDFFNVKALNIIDNSGVFHIITELEIVNYVCTETQLQ